MFKIKNNHKKNQNKFQNNHFKQMMMNYNFY